MKAFIYEVELGRLSAVKKLNILDSPNETVFDLIVKLASEVCEMPIALLSIIDENRQWFKAKIGVTDVKETDRDGGFCNLTIQGDELLIIPDASKDERFIHHALVEFAPKVKFYAGAPITLPTGENIGSLCVIDTKPNQINHIQQNTLTLLAKIISELVSDPQRLSKNIKAS